MQPSKKEHPEIKSNLHPRNKHNQRYNFEALIVTRPELKAFVSKNKFGDLSIDFFNAKAVKTLNAALLQKYYGVQNWDIPKGYLCPPIPGRADYIHYIADLLAQENKGEIPTGEKVTCVDIGIGANLVYPLVGHAEYGWSFIGTELHASSLAAAESVLAENSEFKKHIDLRLQKEERHIFKGAVKSSEKIDAVICNPPFYSSLAEAEAVNIRKLTKLKNKKAKAPARNFGGKNNELWCDGGEERFLRNMIFESVVFGKNIKWFSSLVSKESHLKAAQASLKKLGATQVKIIEMGQGQKRSRILAWTFKSAKA